MSAHPDGQLLLSTVEGFGREVELWTSDAPEGPWTRRASRRCSLPRDDRDAFCDSARTLPSLWDPLVPNEVVLGYRIGTLADDFAARFRSRPIDYWGPLDRAQLP